MKRLVALMSMTVIVGVVVLAGMPTSDHVTAQDGSNPTANPYEVGIGDLPSSAGGNPASGMPELREQPRPGLTNPDRQPNPDSPLTNRWPVNVETVATDISDAVVARVLDTWEDLIDL